MIEIESTKLNLIHKFLDEQVDAELSSKIKFNLKNGTPNAPYNYLSVSDFRLLISTRRFGQMLREVVNMFVWRETEEGHEYWEKIKQAYILENSIVEEHRKKGVSLLQRLIQL